MEFENDKDLNGSDAAENAEAYAGSSEQNGGADTGRKHKPAKRIIIAVIAVLFILLIAARIIGTKEKIDIEPLSTVSVGHADYQDVSIETSLIGSVQPGDVYYVVPKVSGEISEIFVAVGDTVAEGDPICSIDNSKVIDSAKISLDQANVQLQTTQEAAELAKTNLDRMTALYQTGDISKQSYEQTKNGYDQANAAYEAAKLQKEAAELQYNTQVEYSTVTAPVNGTVESTNMSINGLVSQGSQVCVISSDGENKVVFNVTDRLLDAFEPGTQVNVTKQGEEYRATVTSVSTLPSASSGLYQIEAAFTDHNNIANGSSVKLSFVSEESRNVLAVDTDDISYDGGKTYVYTLSYNDDNAELSEGATIGEGNKAGTVHKTEVETGLSNSEYTEITGGIDADSLIITSWTSQLYEGAQVQVLPEE